MVGVVCNAWLTNILDIFKVLFYLLKGFFKKCKPPDYDPCSIQAFDKWKSEIPII
jgi:hypothetical protein